MPDTTFELAANLHLREEGSDFVDANGVRDLVARSIPNAKVDFQRGRLHVEERIERLRRLGTPEIIYRGDTASLDRTICVDIPIKGSHSRLIGFTSGFSYYDGCISFECQPFDVSALMLGSLEFARSLSLDLTLTSQDDLEVGLLVTPNELNASEMISYKFADLARVSRSPPLGNDWQGMLQVACENWLSTHPEARTATRWTEAIGNGESLFSCLKTRIDSLGDVKQVSRVVFDRPFWHHCLVINFHGWTGLLNLSGHPDQLFDV